MTPRERKARLAAYLLSQRGRPAIRPAPRASKAAARVMRPLAKKFGPGASGLSSHWPQIVGEKYARLSQPERLQNTKDGATLIIKARGGAAVLLQADAANIISAVNTFIGQGAVVRLKVVQGQIGTDSGSAKPQLKSLSNMAATASMKKRASASKTQARPQRGLTPSESSSLRKELAPIKNDDLKQALEALGRAVISRQP